MPYAKYAQFYREIGPKTARLMAQSYGISWTQIDLWNIRLENERTQQTMEQSRLDPCL